MDAVSLHQVSPTLLHESISYRWKLDERARHSQSYGSRVESGESRTT
ncbi:hypothetical protein [Perlabentimonas gracilis]|nr:hypothetical protein [Perlabentimonas gracilis]